MNDTSGESSQTCDANVVSAPSIDLAYSEMSSRISFLSLALSVFAGWVCSDDAQIVIVVMTASEQASMT
jgi:hypothetical protein